MTHAPNRSPVRGEVFTGFSESEPELPNWPSLTVFNVLWATLRAGTDRNTNSNRMCRFPSCLLGRRQTVSSVRSNSLKNAV